MTGILTTPYALAGAIALLFLTLLLVIWQPKGIGIGISAIASALVALGVGLLRFTDIPLVWAAGGNALLTLATLLVVVAVLNVAGVFQWLLLQITHRSRGYSWLLFTLLALLTVIVATVFTNVGAVVGLLPNLAAILTVIGFSLEAILAFVIMVSLIADVASLPLTFSNVINQITADTFNLSPGRYALVMIPMSIVAIAASLSVLWFYFGQRIPATYDLLHLTEPASAIRDPLVFRWLGVLCLWLLGGYFLLEPLGAKTLWLTGLASLVLLILVGRKWQAGGAPRISLSKVWQAVPWQGVGFVAGMSCLAYGLHNAGLTVNLQQVLTQLANWGFYLAILGTGCLAAVLSALTHQVPAVILNNLALAAPLTLDSRTHEAMIYANIIGCNLGAKITPIGSLATLVWLPILTGQRLPISWGKYLGINLVLTLPVLFITLLSLALWLPWLMV